MPAPCLTALRHQLCGHSNSTREEEYGHKHNLFPFVSIIVLSLIVVPLFSVYIPEGRRSNRMPSPHAVSHVSRTRPVLDWCRNNQQNLGKTHAPSPNATGRAGQLSGTKTRVHASIYVSRRLWPYFCRHGRVTTTLRQHHAKWCYDTAAASLCHRLKNLRVDFSSSHVE